MPLAGWFYRSFANSFTLCLIVFFALQTLLAVSCLFLLGQDRQAGKGLAAVAENDDRMLYTQ